MKKGLVLSYLLIILLIPSILGISVKECKSDCYFNQTLILNNCSNIYSACNHDCSFNITVSQRKCKANCYSSYKSCIKGSDSVFSSCLKYCNYVNKNITCENGKYKLGETFLDKCNVCRCEYNKKTVCQKTQFCNYDPPNLNQTLCEKNNGLYQQLCNGPYFDIVCSKDAFCLCDGNMDYSCPLGYYCLHEFSSLLTRKYQTIPGYKTLLGYSLGNVGICVQKPVLKDCGNGICENKIIVNTIAETIYNCPIDCKNN